MFRNRYMPAIVLFTLCLALPMAAADSAALYKSKCASCHGVDGAGDTTMGKKLALRSLASPEVQKQKDAELLKIIGKGKGKMPGFESRLSPAELQALVAHIRTLAAK